VDEGREKLNFSTWGQGKQEIDDAIEVLRDGEMPPWNYLPTHPEARLSESEKEALARGLAAWGLRWMMIENEDLCRQAQK
jgi:hypothetical protein